MEATRDDPAAALVVLNGRYAGQRHPLGSVTLLGQDPNCDFRLYGPGVHLQHCLIAQTPTGLALRSLQADGTPVNGSSVTAGPLRDGDRLVVGPFEFEVSCGETPPATETDGSPVEALRIQAATVAALQTGLFEDEIRLTEQKSAVEQQARQLADHFDERRQELLELDRQVREARSRLIQERDDQAAEIDDRARDVNEVRREAESERDAARAERFRWVQLRARYLRRWKRHWSAARRGLAREANLVAEAVRRHAAEVEKLARERSDVDQTRLRIHAELELTRRQVSEQRRQLATEREAWRADRRAADERDATLAARARRVATAEQIVLKARRETEQHIRALQREADGLDQRIVHSRRVLAEVGAEQERRVHALADALVPPADLTPPVLSADLEWQRALLARLAAELADQRVHAAEQVERLTQARAASAAELEELVAECDALARDLEAREAALACRGEALAAREQALQREQHAAARARLGLEGRQARFAARDNAWRQDLERRQAELGATRDRLQRWQDALGDLHRRWVGQRRQVMTRLRDEMERCLRLREEWAANAAEAARQADKLRKQERALAERELALEQARQEWFDRVDLTPAAVKRLERLEKRWAELSAAGELELAHRRQALAGETARFDERVKDTLGRADELARSEAELTDRVANWERERAIEQLADEANRPLEIWPALRDRYEKLLADLRGEVERLASALLDHVVGAGQPPQAA